MAKWLKSCGIRTVAMQSTGVYWIAVQEVLEQAGLEVYLVNARGTKNLPGRKSDVQECQWLMKLHTYGLLRNSFPTAGGDPGGAHDLAAAGPAGGGCGASDPADAKGADHHERAVGEHDQRYQWSDGDGDCAGDSEGERDPRELAKLRDGRIQASEEEIAHSLEGHWREEVMFELKQVVEGYDFYQQQMAECDRELQKYLAALPDRKRESEASREASRWRDEEALGAKQSGKASRGRTNRVSS